jgi:hypothetical protein
MNVELSKVTVGFWPNPAAHVSLADCLGKKTTDCYVRQIPTRADLASVEIEGSNVEGRGQRVEVTSDIRTRAQQKVYSWVA